MVEEKVVASGIPSGISKNRTKLSLTIDYRQEDPWLETFIKASDNLRRSFIQQAREASPEKPIHTLVSARKALELPNRAGGYVYDSDTVQQAVEKVFPGFKEEVMGHYHSDDEEIQKRKREEQMISQGLNRWFHWNSAAFTKAFSLEWEVKQELQSLAQASREQIQGQGGNIWLEAIEEFKENRDYHSAGLAEAEQGSNYCKQGWVREGLFSFQSATQSLLQAQEGYGEGEHTGETMVLGMEVRRQRFMVVDRLVDGYQQLENFNKGDIGQLKQLVEQMITLGYPPEDVETPGLSRFRRGKDIDYLMWIEKTAKLIANNTFVLTGDHWKYGFLSVEAAEVMGDKETLEKYGAMRGGRDSKLDKTLFINGGGKIIQLV